MVTRLRTRYSSNMVEFHLVHWYSSNVLIRLVSWACLIVCGAWSRASAASSIVSLIRILLVSYIAYWLVIMIIGCYRPAFRTVIAILDAKISLLGIRRRSLQGYSWSDCCSHFQQIRDSQCTDFDALSYSIMILALKSASLIKVLCEYWRSVVALGIFFVMVGTTGRTPLIDISRQCIQSKARRSFFLFTFIAIHRAIRRGESPSFHTGEAFPRRFVWDVERYWSLSTLKHSSRDHGFRK